MALINCPECKTEISDKATACPKCGFNLNTPPAPKSSSGCINTLTIFAIIILVLIVLYFFRMMF